MNRENKISRQILGYIMLSLLLIPNEFKINSEYAIYYFISGLIIVMLFTNSGKLRIPPIFKNIFFLVYYITICGRFLMDNRLRGAIFFLISTLGIILIVYNSLKNEGDAYNLLKFLAILGGILAILGILETFTGFNLFDILRNTKAIDSDLRFGLHRSRGMMVVAHNYGAFLLFISTVVFFVWQREKSKLYQIIYILVCMNEIFTFTRATILVFIFQQLAFGILSGAITKPIRIIQAGVTISIGYIIIELFNALAIKQILTKFLGMFLAIIDPSTAASLSTEFGVNVRGVGQRQQLYQWILDDVKGHELFGLGPTARFTRVINNSFTKTSIENQYLALIFKFGWVGLIAYIILITTILLYFYKYRNVGYKINNKLSLNTMFLITFILYYIIMFTFAEVDELYLIHCILGITIFINNKYNKKSDYINERIL